MGRQGRDGATSPAEDADPASGWAGAPTERGHFRADIEGLRAVAVVAVLLFHVGLPGVQGGFIGVDVFYVISGFLITGLLRREILASGGINMVAFYARRARRLLPAALVVIAVTLAASALVLSALRLPQVTGDAAAAALYVVNYKFIYEGLDYLTDPIASPLLHYWSLAVEEQFYLLWPLLVAVAARLFGVRRLVWLVIAIGVPSYLLSLYLTNTAAPLAFYSLPTRAWQLAAGAILAVLPEPLFARLPALAYRAAGWIGLAAIAWSAWAIDPAGSYPGVVALVPTLGAAMVIAAGAVGGGPGVWLSRAVPRWLGRISYSLYLWHWPLLILVPIAIGNDGLGIRLGLAVVAIGVAHLSTRYIETPLRVNVRELARPARTLAVVVLASIVVASVAGATYFVTRLPIRPTVTDAQIAVDVANPDAVLGQPRSSGAIPALIRNGLNWAARDLPPSKLDNCQVNPLGVQPITCDYGDSASSRVVVVLGDSHAAQWLSPLSDIASARGLRLVSFIKVSCTPMDLVTWSDNLHRAYDECGAWRELALAQIKELQPELVVVSGARFYELPQAGALLGFAQQPDDWRAALGRTLGRLVSSTGRVVMLADTPLNRTSPINCLAEQRTYEDCQSSRTEALDPAYELMQSAAASASGAGFASVSDLICTPTVCPLVFGDYIVYRDTGHLTATFSRILTRALEQRVFTP